MTAGAASVESILPSFTLTEFMGTLSTHVEHLNLLTTELEKKGASVWGGDEARGKGYVGTVFLNPTQTDLRLKWEGAGRVERRVSLWARKEDTPPPQPAPVLHQHQPRHWGEDGWRHQAQLRPIPGSLWVGPPEKDGNSLWEWAEAPGPALGDDQATWGQAVSQRCHLLL